MNAFFVFQWEMMVSFVTHWLTPHYSNNHRPKLLQPIGLTLLVGIFLLLQSMLRVIPLAPSLPGGLVLGYASSISASQVVDFTNAERAKAGLPPLTVNAKLNQAAVAKANNMFQNDYWAHIAPDGTTPWVFIKNAGYGYSVAGENLARDFNDTGTMVQAWMNSPTHKANIVHQKYAEMGVAVVDGKLSGVETTLVVQMFGKPVGVAAIAPKTSDQAARSDVPAPIPAPTIAPVLEKPPVVEVAALEPTSVLSENDINPSAVVSPLRITKTVAVGLILVLILVLTYDTLMHSKRNLPRKSGNNWAHIALFGMVLLIIVAMTQGKVL